MSDAARTSLPGRRAPAKTPAAIRASLVGDQRESFEYRYRLALEQAARDFDLTPLHDVIDEWWQIATLTADPVAHQRMLDTAAAVRAGKSVPGLASWDSVRERLGI